MTPETSYKRAAYKQAAYIRKKIMYSHMLLLYLVHLFFYCFPVNLIRSNQHPVCSRHWFSLQFSEKQHYTVSSQHLQQ